MNVESVQCNHCGASLDIQPAVNFVTCNYCGSKLAVRRDASVTFTQQIEELAEKTDRIDENLEVIRLQNELERIDREWSIEREQYRIHSKHGSRLPDSESSGAGSVLGGIATAVFLILFVGVGLTIAGTATSAGAPPIFAIVPIGMIVFAVIAMVAGMVSTTSKRSQYQEAERAYRERRNRIADQLQRQR